MLITYLCRFIKQRLRQLCFPCLLAVVTASALAQENRVTSIIQLDELTSTEVRDRLASGTTTILIPLGGTEQNGPYIVLGKHNVRARFLADKIAQQLGNALVAPVITYVPEGAINPPTSHMRFTGTISIPDAAFNAVLEGAARSFKQHGFRNIIFLGDHGGYQKNLERVAQKLNQEWSKEPAGKIPRSRVIALSDYYRLSSVGFEGALEKRGFTDTEIGTHAGLADTSLMMAVDKNSVRSDAMTHHPKPTLRDGVSGDPSRATVELGQMGVKMIVDGSVAAIRASLR